MRSSIHPLVRWALAISVAFHGVWNLTSEGGQWWAYESGLPVFLRWFVGIAELLAAVSLTLNLLSRLAAAGLFLIFLGAIPQHWRQGFSFKHGGWEPLLVYALLAASIALSSDSSRLRANRKDTP